MVETCPIELRAPAAGDGAAMPAVRETYATKRWAVAIANAGLGTIMVAVGVFLLANLQIAPQVAVQAAILGALLIVGGCMLLVHSLADATSHLTVDATGVRGRFGWSSFDIAWADLRQWRVSDHDDRFAGLVSAELWPADDRGSRSIPGGFLDGDDRRRLHTLLSRYAPDRERSVVRSGSSAASRA